MIELPSIPSPSEVQKRISEAGGNLLRSLTDKLVDAAMPTYEKPVGPPPKFRTGSNGNLSELKIDLSEEVVQHDLDSGRD